MGGFKARAPKNGETGTKKKGQGREEGKREADGKRGKSRVGQGRGEKRGRREKGEGETAVRKRKERKMRVDTPISRSFRLVFTVLPFLWNFKNRGFLNMRFSEFCGFLRN